MSTKKNKATTQEQKRGEIKLNKADNFRVIYTNFAQGGFTPFDISIVFGDHGSEDGVLSVEQHTRIVMSPPEAKAVFALLASTIEQYEGQFGPIQMPKGVEFKVGKAQEVKPEAV